MSAPVISFIYNHGSTDSAYAGTGEVNGDWNLISAGVDTIVFSGGGIDDSILTEPTCSSGTRSATIKPSVASYVIPKTYVESGSLMYICSLVGNTANRYCMGLYVNGICASDIYAEAWDDSSFSTTNSEVLQGSANSSNKSYVNFIRTTNSAPPWHPSWTGSDTGAAYLRGTSDRVGLKNASSVINEALYYNIYIRIETDSVTFNNQPVLAFRYLYV